MLAVGVSLGGLEGLAEAIERGRAAGIRAQGAWLKSTIDANIAAQRDPWGRPWRQKSSRSDGGAGPALVGWQGKVRVDVTDTSWNIVVDDPHASTQQFGRARKGDRRTRPRRGQPRTRPDGSRWTASKALSGSPSRAILPTRVRNSGRSEPQVDFPPEWTREIDLIMDREVQRELDALRSTAAAPAA